MSNGNAAASRSQRDRRNTPLDLGGISGASNLMTITTAADEEEPLNTRVPVGGATPMTHFESSSEAAQPPVAG